MPSHNELVIYQMHVRTYPDNDRGPANQLSAVTNDLWYLQKLGVNAIQLLPAAEFEGDNSWGYNPACIYAIESSYGGPTALKKMVDGAHARGIAVFLDVVYNHLSPRGSKGLYQFTPWHRHINLPGHKELETGGIYFYYDDRAHTDWDDVGRPDFGRPEVRDFIRENALMWLNEYHIDGIRFDSVCNIYNKNGRAEDDKADIPDGIRLLRSINMAVRNTQPRKITIAEDLQKGKWITEEATGEWDGGLGFNTQWNETFYGAIKEGVTKLSDQDRDMWKIADALKFKYNDEAFQRVIYTENHDKLRRMRKTQDQAVYRIR
jgi:1,4-alpha-glucan branching enzyme